MAVKLFDADTYGKTNFTSFSTRNPACQEALIKRGLTQKMLADKLGIHRSVISALLNGKPILLENFLQIGADLGFDQDWVQNYYLRTNG
ncbi:helix-turn-helix domain-containing protein [Nostoc sp. KVJ3]|uniref:helix-turn-helix domain-containing protein n=1 Tax=Nostoc sp. KVJ3 TaxID=457945 RepID=UPI002237CC60|nr:helix-turn-helix transcriptional regulator [Nostoc sp. KVJ3]